MNSGRGGHCLLAMQGRIEIYKQALVFASSRPPIHEIYSPLLVNHRFVLVPPQRLSIYIFSPVLVGGPRVRVSALCTWWCALAIPFCSTADCIQRTVSVLLETWVGSNIKAGFFDLEVLDDRKTHYVREISNTNAPVVTLCGGNT